jgi:hypothetical protein
MPWFRQFITDISPWGPGFNAIPFCVRFVVDKLVVEQVFCLRLSLPRLQCPTLLFHSSTTSNLCNLSSWRCCYIKYLSHTVVCNW